jgi:hypothetical protein
MNTRTKQHVKSLLAILLMCATFIASATGTTFAADEYDYADGIFTPIEKQTYIKVREETGSLGPYFTPEYEAYSWAYSNFYLSDLPTEKEPKLLAMFTKLPAYDDMDGWNMYFTDGDPVFLRGRVFEYAQELGLTNMAKSNSLSARDKSKAIKDFTSVHAGFYSDEQSAEYRERWPTWDCTTQSESHVALYRLAGFPALSIEMEWRQVGSHEGPFFYADGKWRSCSEGYDCTIEEYFTKHAIANSTVLSYATVYFNEDVRADTVLDINESWITTPQKDFMFYLIHKPFAHPELKLTRGYVAKLVCHYLGIVPMKNEQIFSDVPLSHEYSSHIWAVNKLGIMTGNGNGTFTPDNELSIQEFAVMACRIFERGRNQAIINLATLDERMRALPYYDEYTEKELIAIRADHEKRIKDFDPPTNSAPKIFADANKIASWAKPSVDELSEFGILQGDNNSYLDPAGPLSRTRFLVFMAKFDEKFDLFPGPSYGIPLFGD